MRRRAAEISVFSTSFLDLIFCGMSAVTILWVLTSEAPKREPVEAFGFATFGQRGFWHFERLCVSAGGVDILDRAWSEIVSDGVDPTGQLRARGWLVSYSRNPSGDVPALIKLAWGDDAEDLRFKLLFGVCPSSDGSHPVLVDIQTESADYTGTIQFDQGGTSGLPPQWPAPSVAGAPLELVIEVRGGDYLGPGG